MASYMIGNVNCGSASYLFACFGSELRCSPATVFGRINDNSLIPSLISLLEKEFGDQGNPSFHAQLVTDTEEADQILLDEAIDELTIYDDPDPGVYDPPPSRQTMLRASYSQRAERWAEMLRSRKSKKTAKPEDKESDQTAVRQLAVALQELRLATGELLHRSEKVDIYPGPEIKTYHQALRDAEPLVDGISAHLTHGREKPGQIETDIRETLQDLSRAVEHVTSDYNDRPGTYPLPKEITGPGWEALKGLMPLEMVLAMTTMKPGDLEVPVEDRRGSGLILLMLLSQAYYKMLECVVSMASWCSALDVELNQSYLWVTSSLTNLLKNHEDLKDFPVEFKPILDDLYPSTVRDLDWEDIMAPEAERFLSTVQRYVHEKGVYEPEEKSTAWTFVQLFRPSVETAISRALDYHKRMHQYAQKAFGGVSADGSIQGGGAISAAGDIKAGAETTDGGDVRTGSPPPTTPSTKPYGTTVAVAPIPAKDSKYEYEWARQVELVRSTNQVLGQDELCKGVLSRACRDCLIETNGKSGQGSRVRVGSFLPWVARKFSLTKEEQTQVRNAIIGEISERNS